MKIAIASGKGGTGKTTLSTNLATMLAETQSVVLVDLDVEEPNSGLFLQGTVVREMQVFREVPQWTKEACTLCGTCQEVCEFNAIITLGKTVMIFPEMCHGCNACVELCPEHALHMIPEAMGTLQQKRVSGLDFIESRLHIGQEQAVPLIAKTKTYCEEHFPQRRLYLYDSPPGTSCPVIETIKDVDFVILITEPTPFGLHDLTLAVETTRKLGKPFGVVLNRFGIGDAKVESFCEREGIPLLAAFPNSKEVAESYSRGELVYKTVPGFRNELEKLAAYIETYNEGELT